MFGPDANSSIDCLEDFAPATISETNKVKIHQKIMRSGPNTHMIAEVMLVRTSANSYKDSQHIAWNSSCTSSI